MSELILCIGCGASVTDTDDPTHKYIGSSPGCWAIYCEVLAKNTAIIVLDAFIA